MFKHSLPYNCPPHETEEKEVSLYRLIDLNNIEESFKSHIELYPERKNYHSHCPPYGLSFFDNLEAIEKLKAKNINASKTIAKIFIKKEYGRLTSHGDNKGHYTLWLFKDFDVNTVTYELLN